MTTYWELLKLVYEELESVESSFQAAQRTMDQIQAQIKEVRVKLDSIAGRTRTYWNKEEADVEDVRKEVRYLKYKIPYSLIYPTPSSSSVFSSEDPNVVWHPRTTARTRVRDHTYKLSEYAVRSELQRRLTQVCNRNFYFLHHPYGPLGHFIEDTREYRDSSSREVILESCLKQFPVGRIFVKRSLLLNCFRAHSSPSESSEFDHVIAHLLAKGFIRTICKRSSSTVSSYWMEPAFHFRLQRSTDGQLPNSIHLSPLPSEVHEILYSDNRAIIQKKKDVKVLLLGKWHMSLPLSQHIEVADPDLFYKGMENLIEVKYISLRGISMIPEIPQFITKLKKLQTLDCKACHNLEVIPDNINKLRRTLTHLDMSECHLLDHMPPALSDLLHLEVLKGFHVGEPGQHRKSCTLRDLTKLLKLEKLHISTSVKGFPNTDHLLDLQKFRSLRKLGIYWRACQTHDDKATTFATRVITRKDSTGDGGGDQPQFSFDLEKLDLQCVPNTVTRSWLNPVVFKGLKKLYITGGKFFDLGQTLDGMKEEHTPVIANQWTVEILRLKHLRELKMDKSELDHLFPELISLEKVDCPNFTSCCDNNSIWLKSTHPHLKQICLEKKYSDLFSFDYDHNGIWLKSTHPPPQTSSL